MKSDATPGSVEIIISRPVGGARGCPNRERIGMINMTWMKHSILSPAKAGAGFRGDPDPSAEALGYSQMSATRTKSRFITYIIQT